MLKTGWKDNNPNTYASSDRTVICRNTLLDMKEEIIALLL